MHGPLRLPPFTERAEFEGREHEKPDFDGDTLGLSALIAAVAFPMEDGAGAGITCSRRVVMCCHVAGDW